MKKSSTKGKNNHYVTTPLFYVIFLQALFLLRFLHAEKSAAQVKSLV